MFSPRLITLVVATAVSVGLTIVEPGVAQSPKSAVLSPAFDAVSLKPDNTPFNRRVVRGMKGGPGTDDPGRITYTQIYLPQLIRMAWNVEEYQISGIERIERADPSTQLYTIAATMPPDTTTDQLHLMLQNLLVERFHTRFHRETRTLSGYELVVAARGPKLKETTQDLTAPPGRISGVGPDGFSLLPPGRAGMAVVSKDGTTRYKAQAYTIGEFLPQLRGFIYSSADPGFSGPLADKTGLTARYDFTLQFGGRTGPPPTVVAT